MADGENLEGIPYRAIVVGGSAGSFKPITNMLARIPQELPIPVFLCLHRLKHVRHGFVEALSIRSNKKVSEPTDKEKIAPKRVYLAPANYHLALEPNNTVSLSTEPLVNNSRPAIDILFSSAAHAYGKGVLGILLSGANRDGAQGMRVIHQLGGTTIVQDPDEATINAMPSAALAATEVDHVLKVEEIITFLERLHERRKV
ncbi:MAG: chemotaxis protein CheB [Bacteroidota bacterium]